jgi:hypothetical protein
MTPPFSILEKAPCGALLIAQPEDELPCIFERLFRGEEPREMQLVLSLATKLCHERLGPDLCHVPPRAG